MKTLIRSSICLILFLTNMYSHPHSFFEVFPSLYSKGNIINKINIKWYIDDISSSMLIMEFDKNFNGKIDKNEINYIYREFFSPLDEYNFYITIKENNKKIKLKAPSNFKAFIDKNRVVYSFDIVQNFNLKNMRIYFEDKELFVGMILKEEFISLKGIKDNSFKKKIFKLD